MTDSDNSSRRKQLGRDLFDATVTADMTGEDRYRLAHICAEVALRT